MGPALIFVAVVVGIPSVVVGVITTRLFHWPLGVSLAASIAFGVGVFALFVYAENRSNDQELERQEVARKEWQIRHTDPVFGAPIVHVSGNINEFSGYVRVAPAEQIPGVRSLEVYLAPDGFTERQRQFYLHLVREVESVSRDVSPVACEAFQRELNENPGNLSREITHLEPVGYSMYSVRIGRAELNEPTELGYEYDQDAYFHVLLESDDPGQIQVKEVVFWM